MFKALPIWRPCANTQLLVICTPVATQQADIWWVKQELHGDDSSYSNQGSEHMLFFNTVAGENSWALNYIPLLTYDETH